MSLTQMSQEVANLFANRTSAFWPWTYSDLSNSWTRLSLDGSRRIEVVPSKPKLNENAPRTLDMLSDDPLWGSEWVDHGARNRQANQGWRPWACYMSGKPLYGNTPDEVKALVDAALLRENPDVILFG